MKKLIFIALIPLFTVVSMAQGVLKFESEIHNFGTIAEGDPAVHEFTFKNAGDQPIIISNVKASCGCTTPPPTARFKASPSIQFVQSRSFCCSCDDSNNGDAIEVWAELYCQSNDGAVEGSKTASL